MNTRLDASAHGMRIGNTWNMPRSSIACTLTPASSKPSANFLIPSRNISSPPQHTKVGGNHSGSAMAYTADTRSSFGWTPCRYGVTGMFQGRMSYWALSVIDG